MYYNVTLGGEIKVKTILLFEYIKNNANSNILLKYHNILLLNNTFSQYFYRVNIAFAIR